MPTVVKRHQSHTKTGRPEVVRRYIRNGPEHSAKWKRLVARLTRRGDVKVPPAVATAVLGDESYTPAERRHLDAQRRRLAKK